MKEENKDQLIVPVTVEFEDVDSYGIGHHTKMIAYLERARVRFFAERGYPLQKSEEISVHPVLYNVEMKFKKSVQLMDRLGVAVYIKKAEQYRMILGYSVRRGDELVATASTTIAFVNPQNKKLARVPELFL